MIRVDSDCISNTELYCMFVQGPSRSKIPHSSTLASYLPFVQVP